MHVGLPTRRQNSAEREGLTFLLVDLDPRIVMSRVASSGDGALRAVFLFQGALYLRTSAPAAAGRAWRRGLASRVEGTGNNQRRADGKIVGVELIRASLFESPLLSALALGGGISAAHRRGCSAG